MNPCDFPLPTDIRREFMIFAERVMDLGYQQPMAFKLYVNADDFGFVGCSIIRINQPEEAHAASQKLA